MQTLELQFSLLQKRLLVVGFVAVSAVICFLNLGNESLASWDESLYGINAYEMIQQGDWINPYYQGEPDQWNVKPPLAFIPIILNYKIFGYNGWGLRLHSAMAALALVLLFFQFLWKEKGPTMALLTSSILLGCTALIGEHSGRAGDTDAMFSLFIFLGLLQIYKYSIRKTPRFLYYAGIAFGVAFWVKSTAVLLFVPAVLIFLLMRKQFVITLRSRAGWAALAIFLLFPAVWIIVNSIFGITFEESRFGGTNSVANSFLYDTVERLTGTGGFEEVKKKHDFILTFLDSRFNLWHYPFFVTMGYLLIRLFKGKSHGVLTLASERPLLVLSISVTLSVMAILQAAATVNGWYLIPLVPFLAIITAYGFEKMSFRFGWTWRVFAGLAFFTIGRHVIDQVTISSEKSRLVATLNEHLDTRACLMVDRKMNPNKILLAQWNSSCQNHIQVEKDQSLGTDELLLTTKKISDSRAELLCEEDGMRVYRFR